MTSSADPPLVRERAAIRALRSRGTFQLVFGVAFVGFAVVAALNAATWWTVAIGALAGALLAASGVVAWRVARRRLARLEAAHGVGAGMLRPAQAADAEADAPETGAADAEADAAETRAADAAADAPETGAADVEAGASETGAGRS